MNSHTGILTTMGKGIIISKPPQQKLNTKTRTEA